MSRRLQCKVTVFSMQVFDMSRRLQCKVTVFSMQVFDMSRRLQCKVTRSVHVLSLCRCLT